MSRNRRVRRKLVRRVMNRLVNNVKKKIRNKCFYKKGLKTKSLNRAHSQRGGFSL